MQSQSLSDKYPFLASKITTNLFGHMENSKNKSTVIPKGIFSMIYLGSISKTQAPDIFAKIIGGMDNCDEFRIRFQGEEKIRDFAKLIPSFCSYHNRGERQVVLDEIRNNFHMGLVSLSGDQFKGCIPSKIYEYIGLGLPIWGMLPRGDAYELINDLKIGVAFLLNEGPKAQKFIQSANKNRTLLNVYKENLDKNFEKFSMKNKIREVVEIILSVMSKSG